MGEIQDRLDNPVKLREGNPSRGLTTKRELDTSQGASPGPPEGSPSLTTAPVPHNILSWGH